MTYTETGKGVKLYLLNTAPSLTPLVAVAAQHVRQSHVTRFKQMRKFDDVTTPPHSIIYASVFNKQNAETK